MFNKFIQLLSLFLIPLIAEAQTSTIRGTVTSKTNGEAVLFALVYLEGTSMGVQSDINGFYSLTKIPSGTYTLVAQQGSF